MKVLRERGSLARACLHCCGLPHLYLQLEGVSRMLKAARGADWAMCVRAAMELFHADFNLKIKQLLHNFPVDCEFSLAGLLYRLGAPYRVLCPCADTDAAGVKFWSGPKRPPTAADFDASNPLHFAFVEHAAALTAAVYGVPLPPRFSAPEVCASGGLLRLLWRTPPFSSPWWRQVLGPAMQSVSLPPFVPKAVRIKADDKDATQVRPPAHRGSAVCPTHRIPLIFALFRCRSFHRRAPTTTRSSSLPTARSLPPSQRVLRRTAACPACPSPPSTLRRTTIRTTTSTSCEGE